MMLIAFYLIFDFWQGMKKWYSGKVENDQIKKISEGNIEFPNCLRAIPSRPKQIYYRGNINIAAPRDWRAPAFALFREWPRALTPSRTLPPLNAAV